MKSVSLLIALHAVLSSGEQWNPYSKIYPKFQYEQLNPVGSNNLGQGGPYYNGKLSDGVYSPVFLPPLTPNLLNKDNLQVYSKNIYPDTSSSQYLNSNTKNIEHILNLSSKPVNKNYVGNGVLQNNRNQNSLWYNNGREYRDDVDSNQGLKKVNNFVYYVNKTDSGEPQTEEYSTPSQYFTENSEIYLPVVPQLDPNGLYPNNDYDWKQPDPYQNECYNLVDIISDLRILLRKNNISEEKHNLKALFRIIRKFIINNNLERSPFSVVVKEIGIVLLSGYNYRNTLREAEIVQILHHFKNRELDVFLREIRSNPDKNLPDVVSRFARLLLKLKQLLIYKGYSRASIQRVINRAVQWFVPLVGYYFENQCKVKTQQYILQNLEVALNVKLENLNITPLFGGLGYLDGVQDSLGFGNLGNSGNTGNYGGIVVTENLLNTGGLGTPGNLGSLGLGSVGSPASVEGLDGAGSLGSVGSLGGLGNPEDLGSKGYVGDSENQVNAAGLGNPGDLGSLGNVAYPGYGEVAKQGYLGGLGGVGNQLNVK